jgi:hypothetical protein
MLSSSPAYPHPCQGSPKTCSLVRPSSKLTSAAISIFHKVLSLPNSLALTMCWRWESRLSASRRPRSLNLWIALRTI